MVDDFDWGAYLREGEETYSTIYADSDVRFFVGHKFALSLSLRLTFYDLLKRSCDKESLKI